jgi:hydrogenase nickel incorporation protein HypB
VEIKVMDKVLAANDAWALENRRLLAEHGATMLNLIGSPGAGKTTLLEKTIEALKDTVRIGVIEGDIATTRDAERIQKTGVPVLQINTGTACHLDANLVNAAIRELLEDRELDLIFVENIGNLVCPAEFDIGEKAKIGVLSVTEGDDKIEKYPLLFAESSALVITKTAFLSMTDFRMDYAENQYRKLNQQSPVFKIDSRRGDGLEAWASHVKKMIVL